MISILETKKIELIEAKQLFITYHSNMIITVKSGGSFGMHTVCWFQCNYLTGMLESGELLVLKAQAWPS